jgi:FHA domain/Domain of unknown function (DUF1707)
MRASSDPIALGPHEWRASDAEREDAISQLRDSFAEGRLSHETFVVRMDAALRAKFPSELSGLFADLPPEARGRRGAGQVLRDQVSRMRLAASHRTGRGRLNRRALRSGRTPGYGTPGYEVAPGAVPGFVPVTQGAWMPPSQPLILPRQDDRLYSIGRAPSCDFTVSDISVSRWHAKLHKEGEQWLLTDLGSTNGTRLNGWRVTSTVPLRPGDQIMFGNVSYVIAGDRPGPDQADTAGYRPPGTD